MADQNITDKSATTTLANTDLFYVAPAGTSDAKITYANLVTEVGTDITIAASQVSDFDTEVSNNSAVVANSAKISFDTTSSTRLANTSGTNTGDQDLSGKQDNLTLTTTGSSGAATLVGATLNIPQYSAGTASPLTTKGDVYTYSTTDARLGVGTDGQVLTADSAEVTGLKWSTPAGTGDMLAATYDPTAVGGDAFLMSNFVEAADAKIMTAAERTAIATNSAKTGVTTQISNVVEDTTPQLGGNLDIQAFNIEGAVAADFTKLAALTATSTELNYVDGVTSSIQTQLNAKGTLSNLVEDTTPQLGGELDAQANTIGFTLQTATGDGTTTIDWTNGNKFKFTFGAFNETFTFTAPSKPCSLTLVLVQDSVGSRTATWPGTVKWVGGTAPTLTTTATTGTDIVTFFFDGTNYYGGAGLDFS